MIINDIYSRLQLVTNKMPEYLCITYTLRNFVMLLKE